MFIFSGASLSHTDTAEQTPLVHAAKNGHRDTVIYLLGCQTGRDDRNSIDIDDENIEQLVPGSRHALIAAAQNGHLDIVEYLLDTAELIVSHHSTLLLPQFYSMYISPKSLFRYSSYVQLLGVSFSLAIY